MDESHLSHREDITAMLLYETSESYFVADSVLQIVQSSYDLYSP